MSKKKTSQSKSVKIEAVGSRIEIIGGSIYPKEGTWKPLCPCCGKRLWIHLYFDEDACEFSLIITKDEAVWNE